MKTLVYWHKPLSLSVLPDPSFLSPAFRYFKNKKGGHEIKMFCPQGEPKSTNTHVSTLGYTEEEGGLN